MTLMEEEWGKVRGRKPQLRNPRPMGQGRVRSVSYFLTHTPESYLILPRLTPMQHGTVTGI